MGLKIAICSLRILILWDRTYSEGNVHTSQHHNLENVYQLHISTWKISASHFSQVPLSLEERALELYLRDLNARLDMHGGRM